MRKQFYNNLRRPLSLLLTLAMLLSNFPVLTFAEEANPDAATICGIPAHTHGAGCFETTIVIICGQEEGQVHTHSDICYQQVSVLSCGLEENEDHTHADGCYTIQSQCICPRDEETPHVHNETCLYQESKQICILAEHSHDTNCYPVMRQPRSSLVVDVSYYTEDLYVYNNIRYSNADGSNTETYSNLLALATTVDTPFAHNMFIGAYSDIADYSDKKPMAGNINLEFAGLSMDGLVTVNPVYPEDIHTYKTTLNISGESHLGGLTLEKDAILEITLNAPLTIGTVHLGKGSQLIINAGTYSLTLAGIQGSGDLSVNEGIITVDSGITCHDLSVNGSTLTTASIYADDALSVSNANIVASGNITASGSITATNASIANAMLFGVQDAANPVTMSFTDVIFNNVARVGASDSCSTNVFFADGCTVVAQAATYCQDFSITYQAEGITQPAYYRVKSTSLAGDNATIVTEKNLPTYNKDGYTFLGWKTADDAQPITQLQDGIMGKLVLSPAMEAKEVDLTMDLMFLPTSENCDDADAWNSSFPELSDHNSKYSRQNVKLDNAVELKKPQRFGYQFMGWRIKGTDTLLTENTFVVSLDKLLDADNYAITLEAVWKEAAFSLYWTFASNVPLEYITISLNGTDSFAPPALAEKYPTLWQWDSEDAVLRSLENARIYYGESLNEYLVRLGASLETPETWQFPVVRDIRFDSNDPNALGFLNWSTKTPQIVSGESTYDTGAAGFLHKSEGQTWEDFQTALNLSNVVTLNANFGTANYNLVIPDSAKNTWTFYVNGTSVTPADGRLSVPNGAQVTLSCAVQSALSICNWEFAAENGLQIAPMERKYDGGTNLYYDFIMPACNVQTNYLTSYSAKYVDIAKGAITFETNVDAANTGITRNGFWHECLLVSGKTETYGLDLLGMSPLCYVEGKGYFYVWNVASQALYITSDGVATTNQLTLAGTAQVNFNAVNMKARQEYLVNAVGRTIYSESVEKPRDTNNSGSMASIHNEIQSKGGMAPLGNIVLANDGAVAQTFTFTFLGEHNHVGAIFSDQYYYSAHNKLNIYGSGTAALTLGTAFANCEINVKNITLNAADTPCAYLLHAITESTSVSLTNSQVTAPNKEIYVKNSSLSVTDNTTADVGIIVAGSSMSVSITSKLRVRGDLMVGYVGMSIGANCVVVIDGNYLTNYYHSTDNVKTRGGSGAVLIVKGNRCELGNHYWGNGLLICNELILGRTGGVKGGTVIANQIINQPYSQWEIEKNTTDYVFTAIKGSATSNGDNYPFVTTSQGSSTHTTYDFSGGKTYLMGYYPEGAYNPNISVADTPLKDVLAGLLDENGRYNGSAVDEASLKAAIQSGENAYKNNECIVLGNSTYNTDTISRTVNFSGNAEIYASGNLTLFNTTNVSEEAKIWCGGTFGTKSDMNVSGGTITAREVGIAYRLKTTLADTTQRWKILTVSGGNIYTNQIGTLSTCVSDASKDICGFAFIDPSCVHPLSGDSVAVEFDEYVNYLMGTAGFTNPETNPASVHISGTIKDGITYTAVETTFEAPTYDGGNGQWKLNSAEGDSVDGVNADAVLTNGDTPLTTKAYSQDRLVLVAVKNQYNITVKAGLDLIEDVNTHGQVEAATGEAGQSVTVVVKDSVHAADKTVVWYTDANGYVRKPANYTVEGNAVTFTMPYNDVEVFVAPDGMELDLSKYHVTITSDGFNTKLEDESDDREFHYTGSLTILQSKSDATAYRIRVLESVDNINATRSFTLKNISQVRTIGEVGLKLDDGAKAHFKIYGTVALYRAEIPEQSDLVLEAVERNYDLHRLSITCGDATSSTYPIALGNYNGKAGNITIKNLYLVRNGDYFNRWGFSKTLTTEKTLSYIGCYLNVPAWYAGSYLAQGYGTVVIDDCEFIMKAASNWSSPIVSETNNLNIINSKVTYTLIGCTSTSDGTRGLTYGIQNQMTVTDSVVTLTLRNSTESTNYRVYPLAAKDAPVVLLNGNTVYNAEMRTTFNKLVLEDSATFNAGGDNKNGYVFADTIDVRDNATLNADTVLVAGYLTQNVATIENVLETLASSSAKIKNGKNGGLFLNGGTVNTNAVGGDVNAVITVNSGELNAAKIGTVGAVYGYSFYTPEVDENWVESYAKIPVGATVNVNGGTVNVSDYLGGMKVTVNITGGQVNLKDNAILGMTDSQRDILKAYYTARGENIDDKTDNVNINISGGKVEGENGTINIPYGTLDVSGSGTAVKVHNIQALYGDISIREATGTYKNGLANTSTYVGVYVSNEINGQNITISDAADVYANAVYATALLTSDKATLNVVGNKLFAETVGTAGEGSSIIIGEENIEKQQQQFSILYILHDDTVDPASHNNPTVFTHKAGETIALEDAHRYGYVFKGWYDTEEKAKEMDPTERLSQFYSKEETMTLHAAWVPETVLFQVRINCANFQNQDIDWEQEVDALPADTAQYDEENGYVIFFKTVEIPYRSLIQGSGNNHIQFIDFDLSAFSTNTIRFADGPLTDLLQIDSTVTQEILDYYTQKNQDASEPQYIILEVDQLIKKNENLVLHLNQDSNQGRPLHAHFERYDVGKNSLTGSAIVGSKISTAKALMVDDRLNQPMAPGYTFAGWYTQKNPEDTDVPIDENYIVGGNNAMEFYAKWTPNQYTIRFDSVGGSVTIEKTEPNADEQKTLDATVLYDRKINGGLSYADSSIQTLPFAWKPGYKFSHWEVNGIKITTQQLNQAAFSFITTELLANQDVLEGKEPVLTLTAVYTPITVTYHTEGGVFTEEYRNTEGFSGSDNVYISQTNGKNVDYGKPLAGYSLKPTADGSADYQQLGFSVEEPTFVVISTSAEYYSTHHNTYYNEDGIRDYRYDLSKKGYTFKGWTTRDGETFVSTLPAYEDIELWAVWTPNSYKLALHAQDTNGSKFSNITATDPLYTAEAPATVNVTVGKRIDGTDPNQTDVGTAWPNRAGSWYATANPDYTLANTQVNNRYFLGFTFDFLDPGAPNGTEGDWKDVYTNYASDITSLINHNTLFTKVERVNGSNVSTEGSIFFLPESKDYDGNGVLLNKVDTVPDYPNGSTIPMYAVYRERSVVFIERYVDQAGVPRETILHSDAYTTYSTYAESYRNNKDIAEVFKPMGYTFVNWSVNHHQNGDPYPTNASDYVDSLYTKWMNEANSLGSYDINVYTVYAAQAKGSIELTTSINPSDEHAEVKQYPIPGSIALKKMFYTVGNLSRDLTIVDLSASAGKTEAQKKAEFDANRYDPNHVKDVAIWVELVDSNQTVEKAFWLNASGNQQNMDISVGAGWSIRMTLYHSRVIPISYAKQSFDMNIGFMTEDSKNPGQEIVDGFQNITLTASVMMRPTSWKVNYIVNLPTLEDEPHRKVLAENGFSGTGDTRTLSIVNWTYGAKLQNIVPKLEGFSTDSQWTYSQSESFGHGASGTMQLTGPSIITLSSGYVRNSYKLTNSTAGMCQVAPSDNALYHEPVTLNPGTDPAFIWVKFDGNTYRLDKLAQHDDLFHVTESNGSYTFLMPPGDVEIIYENTIELYLGYGTIDISEDGYVHHTENGVVSESWSGNYRICQWPTDKAFTPTANVLNLRDDLNYQTITLGKLDITSHDSIALAENCSAKLIATDSITAKNILVPETATMSLAGKDGDIAVALSPATGSAAIGGKGAFGGTITVTNLDLALDMPAGSKASGIGSGTAEAGNVTVTVDGCDITVTENYTAANGAYSGTWFGGKNGGTVTIQKSSIQNGTHVYDSATICDGDTVTFTECVVGSDSARITKHPLHGENIHINGSQFYLDTTGTTVLSPGAAIHVDQGSATGSVINAIGIPTALYHQELKLYDANSEVTVYDIRLLDVNNGNLTVSDTGTKQESATFAHKGRYQLLDRFDGTDTTVTVTGTTSVELLTEDKCTIGTLKVETNAQIIPLGDLQVGNISIDEEVTLSVKPDNNSYVLQVTDAFGGKGNYVQENGVLTSTKDLTVGGNMSLTNVTVSTDGKVGSYGEKDKVTTVAINGGSVTASTIGACGAQNDTFTFVSLNNSAIITGKLVQDHFRLRYTLNDDQFQKKDSVPVDDDAKKLPTVLRSSTEYANGTGAPAAYDPEIPNAPKYTGEGDSYFGCWYLLEGEEKVALSKIPVHGIYQLDTLKAEMITYAKKTGDGTRTLELIAWMAVKGTGKIMHGRILNQANATDKTVAIETDGAFTARFDVTGAAPKDAIYIFSFDTAIPAGTKLTLSHWHGNRVTYYYCVTKQSVISVSESDFIRMGTNKAADLIQSTDAFEDVLQISADFQNSSASANTISLSVQLGKSMYPIDKVEYTVFPKTAVTCKTTETTVTYSLISNGDNRLNEQNLYLVAEIRNAEKRISAPYDAEMTLDGQPGTWLNGTAVYFPLGVCGEIAGKKTWSLRGLDDGNYTITWYLTAAEESNAPNVFGTVLASSSTTLNITAQEPKLSVALVDPAETYVLEAGKAHTLLFKYNTNGAVSALLEKQDGLMIFSTVSQITVADTTGITVTIPGDVGVYRVRFSLDGFEPDSSDWDDVYFTFLVRERD